jgi:hypothetical protein
MLQLKETRTAMLHYVSKLKVQQLLSINDFHQ